MKSDKTLIRSSRTIRPKNEKPDFVGVSLEARALAFPFAKRLDAALPVLDAVYGDEPPQQGQPTWSIGGASALALRLDHRRRAAREVAQRLGEVALELGVVLRAEVLALELLQRMDQRFGDELAAVGAEVAAGVRTTDGCAHHTLVLRRRSAARVRGP